MSTSEAIKSPPTKTDSAPVPIDVSYVGTDAWDEDMHVRMRWLRENDPLYWSEADGLWVATNFEDVSYISKHQELFTSAKGVRPGNAVRLGLIDEDEPRHGNLRRLINKGFTPRMVRKLEEAFTGLVKETIDNIAKQGSADFVKDVAVPLPLLMIAEMLGIEESDRDNFHRWSDAMIAAEGHLDDQEVMAEAAMAFMEYSAHLTRIIEDRRKNPQEDLVTILSGANDAGILGQLDQDMDKVLGVQGAEHEALAASELIMLCVVLMVAGNETTRNAMSGGMNLLMENPQARQRLIDDPSLIPAAVEEMLRMVSPVNSFSRTVVQDTELRGKKLEKDQLVLMIYPSANRDEAVFADPDAFDIDRNPNHLAFGVGNHFCLGASLARMELRVAFTELLRRLPDMQYAEGQRAAIGPNPLVRSHLHMHVTFTPES